jgi:hypothetical protein
MVKDIDLLNAPAKHIDQDGTVHPWRVFGSPERWVRCMCDDCNNVWGESFETAAKPILRRMWSADHRFELSPDERHTLAVWASIKMHVVDATSNRRVVPEDHAHYLREHSAVYPQTVVTVAPLLDITYPMAAKVFSGFVARIDPQLLVAATTEDELLAAAPQAWGYFFVFVVWQTLFVVAWTGNLGVHISKGTDLPLHDDVPGPFVWPTRPIVGNDKLNEYLAARCEFWPGRPFPT